MCNSIGDKLFPLPLKCLALTRGNLLNRVTASALEKRCLLCKNSRFCSGSIIALIHQMSFQTNVFENGRWVTRSLDPYHVRAQNTRREEGEISSYSSSSVEVPSFGCLTKTLVGSAVIKQIIPARIRDKTKDDVLFISADSIVIKEFSENYTLEDVLVKNDFDSPIQSARTIGSRTEGDEGSEYNYIKQDSETFAAEERLTQVYEKGNSDDVLLQTIELSPHILVLALESSKLVFVCSCCEASNQPSLIWSQYPVPAAISSTEQLGQHLAVDPK